MKKSVWLQLLVLLCLFLVPIVNYGLSEDNIKGRKIRFEQADEQYIAVIPKSIQKRGKLRVYRIIDDSLYIIASQRINTKKQKYKLSSNDYNSDGKKELTLIRKKDGTTYRIFTFYPRKKKLERYIKNEEIKIGISNLNVWGENFYARIPENRPAWAMALAMSEQLIESKNIDIAINDIFAMSIKESKLGCDPDAANIEYEPITEADGCFQFQGPGEYTAWAEMQKIFPNRLGSLTHEQLAPGDKFETSALLLAYYLNFSRGMIDHRNWQIDDFISEAKDEKANSIIYSLSYNRGLWSSDLENILSNKREECLQKEDLTECIEDSEGNDYTKAVSTYGEDLNDAETIYDQDISWQQIEYFLERIVILYPEADFNALKKRVKNIFNYKTEGTISFRYDFYSILDTILENLPEFEDSGDAIDQYYLD